MRSSSMRSTRAAVPKAGAKTPRMTRPAEDSDEPLTAEQVEVLYAASCLDRVLIHDPVVWRWWRTCREALTAVPPNPAPSPPEG